jgi:hypothetical protein
MPTPTKFRHGARAAALAVLAAGGSRRQAARAAGVDHATLSRWLERGERVPEGRYGAFATAVAAAEADPDHLVVVPDHDDDPTDAEIRAAWTFLERREPGFARPPRRRPEPPAFEGTVVTMADGTPVPDFGQQRHIVTTEGGRHE